MSERDNAGETGRTARETVGDALDGTSRRRFLTMAAATGAAVALGGTAIADEHESTVTFDDQTTDGKTVTVAAATLPEGGFVAIHDERLLDGDALGSVVGVSEYLDEGTHEDVEVALFDVKGVDFEEETLEGDQTLIAMPHLDTDGNEEYDFVETEGEEDGPYTVDDEPVVDDAMITVEADDEEPMAEVCFRDQESDGTSVWVHEATLSEGGFVTVHDATLLDGAVFDSVIGVSEVLDAGTHGEIEIALFEGVPGAEFEMEMLEEDATLIAMPHFDTDEDGDYDFLTSEGEEDGPYTVDGEPVVDDATITVHGDGC
ncbi:DUF7282 domain-containing protein [Halegenticoccus tardaugens]|uniref:DUF7282 domain-containing protein n=1 Tax=Halegenticoccus tardaugens TaxID=2071624 RepID=UPI00100C2980|nr:twin-arginine translocation signal domain-containing protein [Halegenticoccus tardaugens]